MKTLLIINKCQFGYHTDTYKYCQYLANHYEITYYCFDDKLPKISSPNINVIYSGTEGSFIRRGINFYKKIYKEFKGKKLDIVFMQDFIFCFIIPLIIKSRNFILDIRTTSVSQSKKKRFFQNTSTKINTFFYKNITVISKGVAQKLGIIKYTILPLGSDIISTIPKTFDFMKLIYVGTFNSRNIDLTIDGVAAFLRKNNYPQLKYDIIGFGSSDEERNIQEKIKHYKLNDIITFHGRIPHNQLSSYFDKSNVGISYVPLTPYFNHQPVTKTYEYLLSGMICLATNTFENKKIINSTNGRLCEDNPESFSDALTDIHNSFSNFDSSYIQNSMLDYSWKNIIDNIFSSYLSNLK